MAPSLLQDFPAQSSENFRLCLKKTYWSQPCLPYCHIVLMGNLHNQKVSLLQIFKILNHSPSLQSSSPHQNRLEPCANFSLWYFHVLSQYLLPAPFEYTFTYSRKNCTTSTSPTHPRSLGRYTQHEVLQQQPQEEPQSQHHPRYPSTSSPTTQGRTARLAPHLPTHVTSVPPPHHPTTPASSTPPSPTPRRTTNRYHP